MRLEIVALGQLSALGRLELLHGAPVPPRVLGGERVDRVDGAVAVVALDLVLRQLLPHGRYPTPTRRSTSWVRRDLDADEAKMRSGDLPILWTREPRRREVLQRLRRAPHRARDHPRAPLLHTAASRREDSRVP